MLRQSQSLQYIEITFRLTHMSQTLLEISAIARFETDINNRQGVKGVRFYWIVAEWACQDQHAK